MKNYDEKHTSRFTAERFFYKMLNVVLTKSYNAKSVIVDHFKEVYSINCMTHVFKKSNFVTSCHRYALEMLALYRIKDCVFFFNDTYL